MAEINPKYLLTEGQRFVVYGVIYKVVRRRPNGKMTIKPTGMYAPQHQPDSPTFPKPMTDEEKAEEQDFFKEKEEPKDAKSNEGNAQEGTVPGEKSSGVDGQADRQATGDDKDSPTTEPDEQPECTDNEHPGSECV